MKKLIAIAVVFTLLVPFAFADVSIGGGVGFGARILKGDTSDESDITTELGDHWIGFNMAWRSDDGTASAKIKVGGNTNKNASAGVTTYEGEDEWGNTIFAGDFGSDFVKLGGGLWWRPLEVLKIELSDLEDEGVFGRGNAIDWGYQANSAAGEVTTLWGGAGWNSFSNGTLRSGNGYFGGLGGGGEKILAVSLYPIAGLAVNLAWDLGVGGEVSEFFKKTLAQVTYDISGIGNLAVSFKGNDDGWSRTVGYSGRLTAQTLGFDFNYTGLSGMNIGVGALLPLAGKYEQGYWMDPVDYNGPIEIGLEYTLNQWSGEAFHLYARAGVVLPQDTGDVISFGLDVNPSYDIGLFRVFFDVGVAMAMDNDNSNLYWHFNPYIRKGLGIGDLYVGINVWNGVAGNYETIPRPVYKNDSTNTGLINWAIPFYFEYSF